MAIDKQIVIDIVENMPDDATMDDLLRELHFRMKAENGIRQLDAGEGVPHEEVKRRILEWHTS